MTDRQTIVLDARAIDRTLRRMADEIVELNDGTDDLIIVGIQRRGVQLAARIVSSIARARESRRAERRARHHALPRRPADGRPAPRRRADANLPWAIDGKHVVIVDDVLYTGRTVRAALDELADFGRPKRIALGRADRPRRTRAADPARRRRQDGRRSADGSAWTSSSTELDETDAVDRRRARSRRRDAVARQGSARTRAPLGRPDPPHPRHRGAVQGDQRAGDQEGPDAARLDDRQPVLRGLDAHARLVRVRREAPLGRHGQRRRRRARASARARRSSTRRAISRRCGSTWS